MCIDMSIQKIVVEEKDSQPYLVNTTNFQRDSLLQL